MQVRRGLNFLSVRAAASSAFDIDKIAPGVIDAGCLNRVAGIVMREVQRATAGASTSTAPAGCGGRCGLPMPAYRSWPISAR